MLSKIIRRHGGFSLMNDPVSDAGEREVVLSSLLMWLSKAGGAFFSVRARLFS